MRSYLEEGTQIRVSGGVIYRITGKPIGEGGGSVTYPALRMLPSGDGYKTGQMNYAVKECYPESDRYTFTRNASGEICVSANTASVSESSASSVSGSDDAERHLSDADAYLKRAKDMQSREETVTGRIYNHAFRLTPVLESYSNVEIASNEGGEFRSAANMISIMESLSGKGRSLKNYLKERKSLKAGEAFEVIRQVLLAVGEVHKSGFLHLDIQDGNIFIKGVLDRNDCMLTLIDFGAARPLLADGMCAEITDRVLFSTRGFTAPEILLKNDGHLRLGKQADIYSIGCLLLLLLTGHRYATAELVANKTGRFIPRFAIRKTGCPSHLIEKMQGIIAKALETDETVRYPSTDDMLADVDELISLLVPHRNPLSATDFDAFICYAHGDKDSAAAKALRDALERYKPGFYQEKKIKRVFLDEGELSSCSDFGERINTALKNSEWLIVLCSEHTRESKWVNEEIKSFLRYHDKSRILAVIIEGEPGEIYPEELIRNGFTAENLLAADARAEDKAGIVRKIKGDVKLQIAAPILNTTFDALKQRKKLYAVQRAFAGTAIVLCAMAGFFAYAALKTGQIAEREKQIAEQAETIVQEQKDKLDSQAALLAKQAQDACDENDYTNAIKLALSSMNLSEEDPERQSNLKRLLIQCMNLYMGTHNASLLPKPTGMFSEETGSDLSGYYLNSDGSRLFSVYEDRFCVWDTSDCSMISSYETESEYQSLLPGYRYGRSETNLIEEKGRCILWTFDDICCWDYETGETVWMNRYDDFLSDQEVLLSEDREHIYRIGFEYGPEQLKVQEIDSATGDYLGEHTFADDAMSDFLFCRYYLSPDNRYIAAVCNNSDGDMLWLFNLEQDTMMKIDLGESYLLGLYDSVIFLDDRRILVSKYQGYSQIREIVDESHSAYKIGSRHFMMACYNYQTGDSIWQYDTDESTGESEETNLEDFRPLQVPHICRFEIDHTKIIAAASGSTFLMLDEESGECVGNLALESAVLSLEETNDDVQLVLKNGWIAFIPKKSAVKAIEALESFPANISGAVSKGSCFYIVSRSDYNVIVKYESGKPDDGYTEMVIKDQNASEYISSFPGDERISEYEGILLKYDDYDRYFEIIGDKSYTVTLDDWIGFNVLSFTPDGNRVFVGFSDKVRLYDLEGRLAAEAEVPQGIQISGSDARLFYPEPGTCLYTDGSDGFLIDINESSIVFLKYIEDAVGYDHETNELIVCDKYQEEEDGVTVGHYRYYTGEELREKAEAMSFR